MTENDVSGLQIPCIRVQRVKKKMTQKKNETEKLIISNA